MRGENLLFPDKSAANASREGDFVTLPHAAATTG
jgi:hypothetical protein